MRVAITGVSGYVGRLLAKAHASEGDTVHGLTRTGIGALQNVRYFPGDLTDPAAITREFYESADVLYHCAAQLKSEAAMRAVNVDGTRELVAAATGSIGHWVQLSTAGVYGRQRAGTITEDSPVRPATSYAATKCEADRLVQENGAFTFTVLRPVGIIGPNMVNRSIYAWLDAVDRGMFFYIGAPAALVNYVHETNVVNALRQCAAQPAARGRTYNLSQDCEIEHFVQSLAAAIDGDPPRRRIPEVAARAGAAVGTLIPRFPLTRSRIDAITRRVRYPTARIERELGFRLSEPLDAAVRDIARVWKTEQA